VRTSGHGENYDADTPDCDNSLRLWQSRIQGSRPTDRRRCMLLQKLSGSWPRNRKPPRCAQTARGRRGNFLYPCTAKIALPCLRGSEHLQDNKLKPDSPTRRVVAGCCNSAMFLDFTKGHWLSMYRGRFPNDAPRVEMRVMTNDKPKNVTLGDDVPNYKGHSGKFPLETSWGQVEHDARPLRF